MLHEFPNRFLPEGASRDLRAIDEAAQRGKKVTSDERYEVVSVGKLAVGDRMRAHFGVFLTFRNGKIVSQRNHDCFEPF